MVIAGMSYAEAIEIMAISIKLRARMGDGVTEEQLIEKLPETLRKICEGLELPTNEEAIAEAERRRLAGLN